MPKTNPEYWRQKFERNLARDRKNIRDLHKLGWRVAVIWECQTLDANSLSRRLARVFHLTSEVLAR
jgi:DNA mismatch endonuclease (patch repair protein)